MHVNKGKYLIIPIFVHLLYHLLHCAYCRMQSTIWIVILSVQIIPWVTSPIVTNDNTIRVNHRYNFENATLSEFLSLMALANQTFNEALHHPRRIRLSRVDTSIQDDMLFLFVKRHRHTGKVWIEILHRNQMIKRIRSKSRGDGYKR